LASDWESKLEKYLKLRHNLIHDFNPSLRLDSKEIDDLHWNLQLFIIAADVILDVGFIAKNLKDEFKRRKVRRKKTKAI